MCMCVWERERERERKRETGMERERNVREKVWFYKAPGSAETSTAAYIQTRWKKKDKIFNAESELPVLNVNWRVCAGVVNGLQTGITGPEIQERLRDASGQEIKWLSVEGRTTAEDAGWSLARGAWVWQMLSVMTICPEQQRCWTAGLQKLLLAAAPSRAEERTSGQKVAPREEPGPRHCCTTLIYDGW